MTKWIFVVLLLSGCTVFEGENPIVKQCHSSEKWDAVRSYNRCVADGDLYERTCLKRAAEHYCGYGDYRESCKDLREEVQRSKRERIDYANDNWDLRVRVTDLEKERDALKRDIRLYHEYGNLCLGEWIDE